MQIKTNKKYILICLLVCSLFLTSYISVFSTNGIISPDSNVFAVSSLSGANEHSSMNGGANSGHVDYMATTDSTLDFSIFSLKQSRWLVTKNSFHILTAIVAAQIICLIYSSRLSDTICTQFSSIRIIFFLHKKDGMK